jgi:nitrite reductase (NO-forming)
MSLLAVFFPVAFTMLSMAALLALLDSFWGIGWGRWPILHLALLGGVSQLVIGAAQFFVAAFLSTDPPSRPLIASQAAAWNAGVLAVVVSRPLGQPELAEIGTVLILLGLTLFLAGLTVMRQKSLQSFHWATRWYAASAGFLVPGVLVGGAMVSGTAWTHGSLLGAHLVLNLLGWFGTAIVGTLHTLLPSLAGSRLRFPRFEPFTFGFWLGGVALLALGIAFDSAPVACCGWAALLSASCLLLVNVGGTLRLSSGPRRLSLRLLASAQLFLPLSILIALASTLDTGVGGPFTGWAGDALPTLVLLGWIGLTVAGSLLHLVAMMARVRSKFAFSLPDPQPRRDTVLACVAVVGVVSMTVSTEIDSNLIGTISRLMVLGVLMVVVWQLARMFAIALRLHPVRGSAIEQIPPAGRVP